ncbi:hypothetical protein JCM33774_77180 [Actinophytocola sp. KF-1]
MAGRHGHQSLPTQTRARPAAIPETSPSGEDPPEGKPRQGTPQNPGTRTATTALTCENTSPQYIRAAPATPGGTPLSSLPGSTDRGTEVDLGCGQPPHLWTTPITTMQPGSVYMI